MCTVWRLNSKLLLLYTSCERQNRRLQFWNAACRVVSLFRMFEPKMKIKYVKIGAFLLEDKVHFMRSEQTCHAASKTVLRVVGRMG